IAPTEYPPDNGIRLPENAISPTTAATAAKLIETQMARDASRAADVSVLTVVGFAGLSSSGSASVTPTIVGWHANLLDGRTGDQNTPLPLPASWSLVSSLYWLSLNASSFPNVPRPDSR